MGSFSDPSLTCNNSSPMASGQTSPRERNLSVRRTLEFRLLVTKEDPPRIRWGFARCFAICGQTNVLHEDYAPEGALDFAIWSSNLKTRKKKKGGKKKKKGKKEGCNLDRRAARRCSKWVLGADSSRSREGGDTGSRSPHTEGGPNLCNLVSMMQFPHSHQTRLSRHRCHYLNPHGLAYSRICRLVPTIVAPLAFLDIFDPAWA